MNPVLKLLLEGGSLTTAQMAQVAGLTVSQVEQHLEQLKKDKIFLGWRPVLDLSREAAAGAASPRRDLLRGARVGGLQVQPEHRSPPHPRSDRQRVPQDVREPADDVQAQSEAVLGAAVRGHLVELAEDLALVHRRDAHAGVPDLDAQALAALTLTHQEPTAIR